MKTSVEETRAEIASLLLSIGAVSLNPHDPYTWASGLKSPIYCDNRMIMGYPDVRAVVAAGFEQLIKLTGLTCEVLAGTATAGIPHAAWLADRMELPMVYVRAKPKAHGRKNLIEGPVHAGQSAIVIEDLISTGKSSVTAVEALQDAGVIVKAVLAIFSYGFDEAAAVFHDAGVYFDTLTNFETLIKVAEKEDHLRPDQIQTMLNWRKNPRHWSASYPSTLEP